MTEEQREKKRRRAWKIFAVAVCLYVIAAAFLPTAAAFVHGIAGFCAMFGVAPLIVAIAAFGWLVGE